MALQEGECTSGRRNDGAAARWADACMWQCGQACKNDSSGSGQQCQQPAALHCILHWPDVCHAVALTNIAVVLLRTQGKQAPGGSRVCKYGGSKHADGDVAGVACVACAPS